MSPEIATDACPRPNKWVVLFTVVDMTFMSTLDSSIVNIALPVMQRELAATAAGIQWVSTVYLLACCATVLIFGRLGDALGKVRLFQAGVALFTAGSALCGLSTTLPALIAARAVQGVGAASAMANNMGIVTEAFPADQRGRALGIVSTFVSLGMMCGPTIGGMLVAAFPWESIFLINVPIGAAAFAVGMRTLPRDAAGGARGCLDVAGAVLVVPAIVLLFCSLTFMAQGVTPALVAMFALGAALLAAFIAVERRAADPLVQLDAFRNVPFSVNLVPCSSAFPL
ncbi:MFS transporter [Collinsella tanakaei]|uniref:MFS transporter n=1 Tax=Collinsella tanakaei TaxID=626935 RepID=UPI00315B37FE